MRQQIASGKHTMSTFCRRNIGNAVPYVDHPGSQPEKRFDICVFEAIIYCFAIRAYISDLHSCCMKGGLSSMHFEVS